MENVLIQICIIYLLKNERYEIALDFSILNNENKMSHLITYLCQVLSSVFIYKKNAIFNEEKKRRLLATFQI